MSLARALDMIRLSALDGGPGFAQIAVTNDCNANCGFCNFARDKFLPKRSAPTGRLLSAIDILFDKGIRYIVLVGGEPLMYRGLEQAIAHTRDKGAEPIICTNGQMLTAKKIRSLWDAGLRNVIISIDATDDAAHDANRGLPGLSARIRQANGIMGALGMHVTASVTVSRLLEDVKRLPAHLAGMGFEDVTFSYPLQQLHSTYLSFSDSELVEFSKEELIGIFEELKELKKNFRILNPEAGMDEMVRFLKGEPAFFPCLAGYKYFFLDWDLDVYRCHFVDEKICPVEEFGDAEPIRDGCARCMIDCYRDPSVLQHCAVSLSDCITELKAGRPLRALGHIFRKQNYLSVKAVAEEFSLVRRYRER